MFGSAKKIVFWFVVILAAFLLFQVVRAAPNDAKTPEISYSEFVSRVGAESVAKVRIAGVHIDGWTRDGATFRLIGPTNQSEVLEVLRGKDVEIWFSDQPEGNWGTWLANLAPLILLAALWFFMIRSMRQRQVQSAAGGPVTPT